jgi:hypothetical protein
MEDAGERRLTRLMWLVGINLALTAGCAAVLFTNTSRIGAGS